MRRSLVALSTMAGKWRPEPQGFDWPKIEISIFMIFYMTALAYLASLCVYQGGQLLGFS